MAHLYRTKPFLASVAPFQCVSTMIAFLLVFSSCCIVWILWAVVTACPVNRTKALCQSTACIQLVFPCVSSSRTAMSSVSFFYSLSPALEKHSRRV